MVKHLVLRKFGGFLVIAVFLSTASLSMAAPFEAFGHGPDDFTWTKPDKNNCVVTNDAENNKKLAALAQAVLGKSDGTLGCVTGPYMEAHYDENGKLGIWNDVHAGVDLKADGAPVMALEGGTVVGLSFCVKSTTTNPQQQPCDAPDSAERSTLIIENDAKTYKVLYVHMREIDVSLGESVQKGARIGTSGSVGALNPHLHLEVWPATAPQYCDPPRIGGVSGSFCPGKKPRKTGLPKKTEQTAYCELEDIMRMTVDPAKAADLMVKTGPWKKTNLSTNSRATFYGFGPVRAGMTLMEARAAIGGDLDYDPNWSCYAYPRQGPGGVSFMVSDDKRISRVDIDSCRLSTDRGAKIGDTESKIRHIYPNIETSGHQYDEKGHYMFVSPNNAKDDKYLLLFETDGRHVTTFRSGLVSGVRLVEGCF